jgi:RNA polymerase sigma factor for flagellar operon FliA
LAASQRPGSSGGILHACPSKRNIAKQYDFQYDVHLSAGIFGLVKAIDAFDPKRHVEFEKYCTHRIRGAILDELRNLDWVPRQVRAMARKLIKITRVLETELGRAPTDVEMADKLGLDMEKYWRFQRDAQAVGLLSLHSAFKESDGENDFSEIHIHADNKSRNPQTEAQKRDLKEFITKGFTRIEQLIIVLYYYEEMTMKEIGRTLGISESRVSQMHTSIIARMKVWMDRHKKEFDL